MYYFSYDNADAYWEDNPPNLYGKIVDLILEILVLNKDFVK